MATRSTRKHAPPDPGFPSWKPGFNLYRDVDGEWRWFLKAKNGRTLADSGEGYQRKIDAIRAIDLIRSYASYPQVHQVTEPPEQ